mmetsp:Transcript_25682/g.51559  ORF Transcript_25682/g.51559 Transcript_25682/m.51559 type:complete len:221 (+) Transcript_25682:135-797(+)
MPRRAAFVGRSARRPSHHNARGPPLCHHLHATVPALRERRQRDGRDGWQQWRRSTSRWRRGRRRRRRAPPLLWRSTARCALRPLVALLRKPLVRRRRPHHHPDWHLRCPSRLLRRLRTLWPLAPRGCCERCGSWGGAKQRQCRGACLQQHGRQATLPRGAVVQGRVAANRPHNHRIASKHSALGRRGERPHGRSAAGVPHSSRYGCCVHRRRSTSSRVDA